MDPPPPSPETRHSAIPLLNIGSPEFCAGFHLYLQFFFFSCPRIYLFNVRLCLRFFARVGSDAKTSDANNNVINHTSASSYIFIQFYPGQVSSFCAQTGARPYKYRWAPVIFPLLYIFRLFLFRAAHRRSLLSYRNSPASCLFEQTILSW